MHGRKKAEYVAPSAEELAEKRKKIAKYCRLKDACLDMHERGVVGEEGMQLTDKLIEINPDFYTLWNFRRDLVEHAFADSATDAASDTNAQPAKSKKEICDGELALVERALRRNPKSYCAWAHRLWVIDQGASDLDNEIALCAKFLSMDSRNFHCWNYRRFVVERLRRVATAVDDGDAEGEAKAAERVLQLWRSEFDYTTTKINENFSNYSAWHYRSVLFPRIHPMESPSDEQQRQLHDALSAEFALLQQAFYTEPDDQSAWLYHRWLIACSASVAVGTAELPSLDNLTLRNVLPKKELEQEQEQDQQEQQARNNKHTQFYHDVLRKEAAVVAELLEIEPECKWVHMANCFLVSNMRQAGMLDADKARAQLAASFKTLQELDPMRSGYYQAQSSRIVTN